MNNLLLVLFLFGLLTACGQKQEAAAEEVVVENVTEVVDSTMAVADSAVADTAIAE